MNDRRFNEILGARERGLSWREIAEQHNYVDAASAEGSFRVMLRKRGLRAVTHETRTLTITLQRRVTP